MRSLARFRSAAALVLAAASLAAAGAARANGAATVGSPAPPFRLEGLRGAPVTLAAFRGRPLYVNVFASWCPPCRLELPGIVAEERRFGPRVAFLGVDAQETTLAARRFSRAMGVHFPVGVDLGQMAVTYGASSLPESVFIDRNGIVRAIVHGTIDRATLDRDLASIAH